MPSTYSPNLRIELIASGEQANTWGYSTDNNLGTLIEQAISGEATITMVDADVTLSVLNGVTDQSRQMIISLTGTNGAVRNIVAPPVNKLYVISNGTAGGYAVNIKTSAAGSTGVLVPNGASMIVWSDGTNFYSANTSSTASIIEGNLTVQGTLGAFPTAAAPASGVGSFGVLSDGAYGGGVGLLDTTGSVAWGIYDNTGTLNIGTGSGLSGALTSKVTIDQSGNLATVGSVSGTTGTFSGAVSGASFSGAGTGLTGTAASLSIGGNAATATNATNAATLTGNWTSMPAGTVVVFYQAAAPTGWTQVTTSNDAALRVVSGAGGTTGGTVGFTTAFASQAVSGSVSIATATGTVGGTAITTAQLPAHSHGVTDPGHSHGVNDPGHYHYSYIVTGGGTGVQAGGGDQVVGINTGTAVTGISIQAAATGISTQNTGSGSTHTHSLTMDAQSGTFSGTAINLAVKYINTIICSKN